ncbi:NAC domain-containing protein 90-like [Benincasa hispida]|uniref:NAC domain-containing protein 90-like n=1 Tax=Benincasa hispida TaxID=102211 RepID=UPI00190260F1|nr:NAC domain-containing protein 90-like [Benincasa hispida]
MAMPMDEEEASIHDYPPGFRFYPTEEELVSFYLRHQLHTQLPEKHRVIPLLNIYDSKPWDLPKLAGELCKGDSEQWFFFVARQEREARGGRPTRTTAAGYWKATGSPVYVYSSANKIIGLKKTMVFYKGRAPTGTKTKWKKHEYRAIDDYAKLRHEFSLCRVYVISGCFRAFDRRPMEVIAAAGNNQDRKMKGKVTSPEISCSAVAAMADCDGSGSNWRMVEDEEFEEPIWEWNKIDWP